MTLPPGPFDLILADPAWQTVLWSGAQRTPTAKRGEDHYPTMSLNLMAQLPVVHCAANNSLLVMWTIGSHLDQAMHLGAAWGFRFVTDLFYWAKQHPDDEPDDIEDLPIGMGKHSRKQVEPCLLFKRGKGLPVLSHAVRQMIVAPKRTHSRKPPEQYDRLDALYGTHLRRLELFSRTPRAGIDLLGKEAPDNLQGQRRISSRRPRQRLGLKDFAHGAVMPRPAAIGKKEQACEK